jgi:hypothetical protein
MDELFKIGSAKYSKSFHLTTILPMWNGGRLMNPLDENDGA